MAMVLAALGGILIAERAAAHEIVHPGILVTLPMLQHIRINVKNKVEPQWSAYLDIMNPNHTIGPTEGGRAAVWLANLSYTAEPEKLWIVNNSLSPGTRWLSNKEDALAAYTHALLWFITEDERHAVTTIRIMDAWAAVLTEPVMAADGLEAAWSGTCWCRAAEIIKHTTRPGLWPAKNASAFSNMLTRIYLPWVNDGASTNGNIAMVMSETLLHIGVFTDNRTIVDAAVDLWRGQIPSFIYISSDGPTPKRPPLQRYLPKTAPVCDPTCDDEQIYAFWHGNKEFLGHDGVAQETCRDLGHTNMMFSAVANFAETAYHQGIDLYTENARRIISGAEFQASMMNDEPAPFFQPRPKWLCEGECPGEFCKDKINGSTFDILHHHFVHRMNISMPNVTALLPHIRPTGCFDQLCWETLTHGVPLP